MQDPAQIQDQTAQSQDDAINKPVEKPVEQAAKKNEPEVITGSIEHEPIETTAQTPVSPEEVPAAEAKITLPEEVVIPKELNKVVEKGPDAIEPKIDKELQKAGVTQAKESTPVVIMTPAGNIKLPETYTSAWEKEKKTKLSDSGHWYAALLMYLWSKYDPDAVKEAKQGLKK